MGMVLEEPAVVEVEERGEGTVGPLAERERFRGLVDGATGPIGRVVGSEKEPAGGHAFCIWATESALSLDVGHVVVAFSEEAAVIGVVDEPRRFSDLKSFLDDYFDRMGEDAAAIAAAQPTQRPEILVFTVNVLATQHLRDDVDSHRPPVSGPVWFATRQAIDYALGVAGFAGVPIPALLHTNGNVERDGDGEPRRDAAGNVVFQRAPIWLDSEYLLGPEAGHANWTGQSGLATKTSHALFLISAAFQKMAERGTPVAALMFNVKGPDLLWLDKPADPEPDLADAYAAADCRGLRAEDREAYEALGLVPKPFAWFRIFAPFRPGQIPDEHGGAVSLDRGDLHPRLNTLRTKDAVGVVHPIAWDLEPLLRMPHKVFDRADLDDKLFGLVAELRERGVTSVKQFEELFDEIMAEIDEGGGEGWRGHNKMTILKAKNRIQGLPHKFNGLLAKGNVAYGARQPRVDEPFADQELRVVDIAQCNSHVQELLVTSVIDKVWRMAEEQKLGVEKVIVFVDELNKYAPGGGQGGLRDTLVDIAARGRHLNVVLLGAQQFRSKVDDEILGNCGTSFYGRVGDEEIVNAAYRSLSETVKAELLGLPKGRLLVRHAHFRSPLFGAFPMPPTINGAAGQRVFNPEKGATPGVHPGDGLWRTLQTLLGDRAPSQGEVRRAAEGVPAESVERVSRQLDVDYRANGNARRVDPWKNAQALLARYRER